MKRLELLPWKIEFKPSWDVNFKKFDRSIQEKIMKKLDQMEQPMHGRGMHHSRYLVEEVGQYRIAYELEELRRTKFIHFVGNHKQYEKWYRN